MNMQLFLISLALNLLTIAIPVGIAVYIAVRLANKASAKEFTEALNKLKEAK